MSDLKTKIKLCAFADEADSCLEGQIKALRENGIPLLEIRGVDGQNIADISLEKTRKIKETLDNNGIQVWSVGSPAGKTDINADFSAEKERFVLMLEKGKILGAKCIRLFSFYGTGGKKEYEKEVFSRLSEFVRMSRQYDIIPCHENEKGIYGENAERCLEIHRNVPGLMAVFDPANFIQCGQDVMEAWRMLSPYVFYGHIKDADLTGRILPPGEGIGHIADYLPDFVAKGCSVLTLEPHLAEFVGLSGLENDNNKSNVGSLNFKNNREAFDCAADSLKKIIDRL